MNAECAGMGEPRWAPPRVAFVRTMTPLHDLGGNEVVIIYALGDTQKLDTFVDTFLDRTNRSEALRISAEVNHMRRAAGEHPDPVMIRRILREHPARGDAVLARENPFLLANRHLERMGARPVSW